MNKPDIKKQKTKPQEKGILPRENEAQANETQINETQANDYDTRHHFQKNDHFFSLCIYIFLLVLASAIAIKAIFSFGQTRAFFSGLFRAISPFLIAILIAYILMPFVRVVDAFLSKCFKKLPEKPRMVLAMLVVYLIAIGLVIALLIYILPEVVKNLGDLIRYIPQGYEDLIGFVKSLQERFPNVDFSSITNMLQSTQSDLVESLQSITGRIIPVLYTASVSIVTWFANFIIAIVVSVYMLYGKSSLLRMFRIILYALVPQNRIPVVKEVIKDCNHIFGNFVVSKMIDSVIIGILCAILMTILRLPYTFLISVFVGVTNMIPYFGPFIGAIPGIVIMLVISPIKALIFTIMILCLQQFDGLVLGPKLLGNSTGMKPIWIIFAITIGGKFFGVVGMFLGVPFVAIIAYLAERFMAWRLRLKQIDIADIN